ncbi:MAG: nitrous oxide-stimulated promoter family protein [Candidatus Electrothrix sp. EH2]|nr:nitrous oxide-stimulated promoter family protein [Candidatus Electrothrix sp. EH2]
MKKAKISDRIQREGDTVALMIRQYCRLRHGSDRELCADCRELLNYAEQRLAQCPFQENKTTCGKCRVHCYKSTMRKKIRKVMRTVGPRMLLTNPVIALRHAVDGIRKEPVQKKNKETTDKNKKTGQ